MQRMSLGGREMTNDSRRRGRSREHHHIAPLMDLLTKQQQPHQITHLCVSIDTSVPSVNGSRTCLSKHESRGFLRKTHFEGPAVEHRASWY